MADYFYYNTNGKRQGPVSEEQLKELAAQRIIKPNTLLRTLDGQSIKTEQIPGLNFPQHYQTASMSGLFDIGFTWFFSNNWISIIWSVVIIVHFLAVLGATFYLFTANNLVPFLIALLLVIPMSLLFWRMVLELEVIFFRIETNTHETKEYLREIKEQLGKSRRAVHRDRDITQHNYRTNP